MKRLCPTTITVLLAILCLVASYTNYRTLSPRLDWQQLPSLPPAPGQSQQFGLAGPFSGIHNDVLILAGGANFPDKAPWRGGKKVWWADIYVLEKLADGTYCWLTDEHWKLPRPSAYGASIPTDRGLICIGGCDAERCHDAVFRIAWNPSTRNIEITDLPPLPQPLAFMAGAQIDETIYITGGLENLKTAPAGRHFCSLDLASSPTALQWKEQAPWTGPGRVTHATVAQRDGAEKCLFVFGGRKTAPGMATKVLDDAYKYHPSTNSWHQIANLPHATMAGAAAPIRQHGILVFGGDTGEVFLELERLGHAIQQAPDETTAASLKAQQTRILETHPGFSREILYYDTIDNAWTPAGQLPSGSQVTTTALWWDNSIIIPSGEIRPGVRTPNIWKADLPSPQSPD